MRSYWAGLLAPALLWGCGPTDANGDGITDNVRDPNNVTLVGPSTPTGTVSGQVLDSHLAPLAGATVRINVGGRTTPDAGVPGELEAITDSAGNWSVDRIPAGGSVLVTISNAGYSTVRTTATVPAATGDYPMSNANANVGPYVLAQLNSTLKVEVVTSSGRPAQNAQATLECTPAGTLVGSGSYGTGTGVVVAQATVDANGVATFANVPAPAELARIAGGTGNYTVTVAALDSNGDGFIDSGGSITSYSANSLNLDTSVRVIVLPDPRTGAFQLTATNVPSLASGSGLPMDNMVNAASNEPINLVFNQVLQSSSVRVILTDEFGTTEVPTTYTVTGNVLMITPSYPSSGPGAVKEGAEYNLSLHVVSADTNATYTNTGFYFAGLPLAPPAALPKIIDVKWHDGTPGDGILVAGERVDITFDTPMGYFPGWWLMTYVYVNYDLDVNGVTGNYPGEKGYDGSGWYVYSSEPTAETGTKFSLKASGYTSRWSFTWAGPNVISPSFQVLLDLGKNLDPTRGMQSVWGVQPGVGSNAPNATVSGALHP